MSNNFKWAPQRLKFKRSQKTKGNYLHGELGIYCHMHSVAKWREIQNSRGGSSSSVRTAPKQNYMKAPNVPKFKIGSLIQKFNNFLYFHGKGDAALTGDPLVTFKGFSGQGKNSGRDLAWKTQDRKRYLCTRQ